MRRWTAAALLAGLLLSACHDAGPAEPGTPAPRIDDLAVASTSLRAGCPEPRRHLPFAPQGRLPRGATLVRLCNAPQLDSLAIDFAIDAPSEALIRNPDRVVDAVNSAVPPEPPSPGMRSYCPADAGSTLDFWFGYPGGRVAAVRWHDYGCGLMETGAPADVAGGNRVLSVFAALLSRQREDEDWRWSPRPPPGCNPTSQPTTRLPVHRLPALATLRYCTLDDQNRWRQAVVPRRLARRIDDESARDRNPRGPCPVDRSRFTMFRGLTTHDDRVEMWPAKCGWTLPRGLQLREPWPSWRPSRALVRALEQLPLSPPVVQRDVEGHAVGQPS